MAPLADRAVGMWQKALTDCWGKRLAHPGKLTSFVAGFLISGL